MKFYLILLLLAWGCAGAGPEKSAPPMAQENGDQQVIERTLETHSDRFSKCYSKEIFRTGRGKEAPQGTLTLAFTLNPQGQILKAGVEESQMPLPLKACLVEALWEIPFPRLLQNQNVDVRLPLNFQLDSNLDANKV